jgi:hypothetical protein
MLNSCETKQKLFVLVVTEMYPFILSSYRLDKSNGTSTCLEIVASFGICTSTVCL